MTSRIFTALFMTAATIGILAMPLPADDEVQENQSAAKETKNRFGKPPGAVRLSPEYPVWVDKVRKLVIMDGEVCLREGPLEMFICPAGTKEHESIIAVPTKAYLVHAGLLAVGAEPGKPVQWDPEYKPASGTPVEIFLLWIDKDGKKHNVPAQQWIRDAKTKKQMPYTWVFAGSGFWEDETTGQRHYFAEGGDFICVSNFPSAMLDVTVKSTQANQGLLFEAFTENIPPLDTPVRVVLRPKLEKKDAPKSDTPAESK